MKNIFALSLVALLSLCLPANAANYVFTPGSAFSDPTYSLDVPLVVEYLGASFCTTSDLSDNTQTTFENANWNEEAEGCPRPKPAWSLILSSNASAHNTINQLGAQGGGYLAYQQVPILKSDMITMQSAVSTMNDTLVGLSAPDLSGLVPKTYTVNGHALSGNLSVTKSDLSIGNIDNTSDANKPISTATQSAIDGKASLSHTHAEGDVTNLTSDLSKRPIVYVGATQKSAAKAIFKTVTISSGVGVVYLTSDGTSGGSALCTNVYDESVNMFVSDAAASYQLAYALTNSNKTFTVTANKLSTANILTGILGQAQANSAVVKIQLWCD